MIFSSKVLVSDLKNKNVEIFHFDRFSFLFSFVSRFVSRLQSSKDKTGFWSWKSKMSCKVVVVKQGCTTQISWRAKKIFSHIQGPKFLTFTTFKRCFHQRNKQTKQNLLLLGVGVLAILKASTGHIWLKGRMLCMPVVKD